MTTETMTTEARLTKAQHSTGREYRMTYRELIAELNAVLRTQEELAYLRDDILSKTDIESEVNIVAIDIVASLLHEKQRDLQSECFALIKGDISPVGRPIRGNND